MQGTQYLEQDVCEEISEAVKVWGQEPQEQYTLEEVKTYYSYASMAVSEIERGGTPQGAIMCSIEDLRNSKGILGLAIEIAELAAEEPPAEEVAEVATEEIAEKPAAEEDQPVQVEEPPAPIKVGSRSATFVFQKDTNAIAPANVGVVGLEPIYPAAGLMIIGAEISSLDGDHDGGRGKIENPVLPFDVVKSLGLSGVSGTHSFTANTFLFRRNTLRYSGDIRKNETRENLRSMETYINSIIGNPSFSPGDGVRLKVDQKGANIKFKSEVSPQKLRDAIDQRGTGINKILGIPTSQEAALERRPANGINYAEEYFSFADKYLEGERHGNDPQVEIAAIYTEEDVLRGKIRDLTKVTMSHQRVATFILALVRTFSTEDGGGRITRMFKSALDRADSIRAASMSGSIRFEDAAKKAFSEVIREIAGQTKEYAATSLFPARREMHNRILRRRAGDSAVDRAFKGAKSIGPDDALAFLNSKESGKAPNILRVTLADFVEEMRSVNEAVSGAFRLLQEFYTSPEAVTLSRTDWTPVSSPPKVSSDVAPASWAVRVNDPVRISGGRVLTKGGGAMGVRI